MAAEEVLFRRAKDLFCIAVDGTFVEVNPAWTEVLGWTEEELKSKPFVEFVHPADREVTSREEARILDGQGRHHFENRYITKEGDYRWLQWTTSLCPGGIAGVARDITREKEREARLLQSRDTARFFQYVVEETNDPVYLISPADGFRFHFVNQATATHFGWSKEQLLQMAIPQWDPNFTFAECETFWEELKREKLKVFETEHHRSNGETVPVEVTANYLALNGQEYITGTIRNIKERKRAAEELSRFAYSVSHDLQEPLRTITSYLQLLEKQVSLNSETEEYIRFTTDAASRMRNLIRGLLDYSRVGRDALKLESTNLNRLLDNVIQSLQKTIGETEAKITHEPLPTVTVDSILVFQLFQNLIENALKYRRKVSPEIHLSAERKSGGWAIHVADNGIGIAPQYFDRIFEVFRRLHVHSEFPGVGIGLATCKRVVELHGGRIWVESTPGKGSTFSVCFPDRPTPR